MFTEASDAGVDASEFVTDRRKGEKKLPHRGNQPPDPVTFERKQGTARIRGYAAQLQSVHTSASQGNDREWMSQWVICLESQYRLHWVLLSPMGWH